MTKIIKTRFDKEVNTQYYSIEDIPYFELENIYRLLKAEEARAKIVKGWNRGSKELLKALESIAKERFWEVEFPKSEGI